MGIPLKDLQLIKEVKKTLLIVIKWLIVAIRLTLPPHMKRQKILFNNFTKVYSYCDLNSLDVASQTDIVSSIYDNTKNIKCFISDQGQICF